HVVARAPLGRRAGAGAVSGPLKLPLPDGTLSSYLPRGKPLEVTKTETPFTSRVAYAATHVGKDPIGPDTGAADIDWEATIGFREHLWSYGLGVAEAMDTAQRGMGLDYAATKELISRSCAAASASGGRIVCGAGTDHLPTPQATLEQIAAAYEEQCEHIEAAGGRVVIMASRHLAAAAKSPEDYAQVYHQVLSQVKEPVIIHWL